MGDTERPTQIETVDKAGQLETLHGPFHLFVDPEKNRIGIHDTKDGWIAQVPLSDVVELIRGKVL